MASSVKVEKTNWSKGDRGYVAEHNVLIFNPCKFKIKDIEFKANYYSNSSTQIGSTSHTVYEVINPNSRKWLKFSGLVHPQASSSSVTISSVKKIE
ncbi:MAG: hypothetical protein HS129_05390 [Leptospiraceae bacterium]|nr:hypothetical protein [Leptospiraceae bacterium]